MSIKTSFFVLLSATFTVVALPIKFVSADGFLKKWDAQKREMDLYQVFGEAVVFPDELAKHLDLVVNAGRPNYLPKELVKLIAVYGLVPLDELMRRVVTPERIIEWEVENKQLIDDARGLSVLYAQQFVEYESLLDRYNSRASVANYAQWESGGFRPVRLPVQSSAFQGTGAMQCAKCGDPQSDRTFGFVTHVLHWQRPQYYHFPHCEKLAELVQQPEHRLHSYGDQVPMEPAAFGDHTLLHLDVYARRVNARDPNKKTGIGKMTHTWFERLFCCSAFLPVLREMALYLKDPKAWIEKENKLRDQEHQIELPARLRPADAAAAAASK